MDVLHRRGAKISHKNLIVLGFYAGLCKNKLLPLVHYSII